MDTSSAYAHNFFMLDINKIPANSGKFLYEHGNKKLTILLCV